MDQYTVRGEKFDLRILGHSELNETAGALEATNIVTIHRKHPLVLSFHNLHVVLGPIRQTRVRNDPLLARIFVFRSQKLDELVNVFSSLLQPIPEIIILVEDALLSTKRKIALVFPILEYRIRSLLVEHGLKDDLGRCSPRSKTAKVVFSGILWFRGTQEPLITWRR